MRGLTELATAELTYQQVGATRDDALPAGYDRVRRDVVVGHGREAFNRAAAGVFDWRMHREAGLAPISSAERATPGAVVVLRAGLGPVRLTIPCRVVYTVVEDRRRGFAYGTLPGHPERGEEAFLVELAADGAVWIRIRAFSRPASLPARAGGPLTRLAQRYATNRYVAAARRLSR
ncbi:DUF1990 domain-containing protein [Actinoplanes ianthinogenes]|uniref:DUF1990 domain-containing protein n=1 Tax=Actinoplanes ianthinogenes TaxID=122358 RepID=A0ABM7LN30_9ACTN|nr:DUF1990 domain-containing protein [Actinoplanes ianthinogenes]BCJ40701.1 DUF1990 domain-containing protein [Actinoplanes ianthinogenes]GGR43525.1 DUF1990 domain-containing protein [Actinoplanes ianthinogenes]